MKDAYYFPHDSNAKDDPKCILLIEQLGLEGYGIYWVLVETLRDQPNYCYPLQLLPALARRFNTTLEKMKTVVLNYGLFHLKDDTFFFSQSLISRMSLYEEKKLKRSLAGKKGNEIRWQNDRNAIAIESHCDRIESLRENSKVEDIKVKEKKKNELSGKIGQLPLKTIEEKKEKSCAKKERLSPPPDVNELIAFCTSKFDSKYINDKTVAMFSKLLKSYSKEQIKQAIENGKKDEFWTINFLSPLKLQTQSKEGVYYIDKFLTLKLDGNNKGYNKSKQPEHIHNGSKFEQSVTKDNF